MLAQAQLQTPDDELREKLEAVIAATSFASMLGAKVLAVSPGNVELAIDVKPGIMNQHHGFVHGAVIGFVADSACAWAAGSLAGDVVTSEYTLHFLAPAVGDRIVGRGRVVKNSSRIVVAQADVYAAKNGNQKLVAVALATLVKVDRK
jgi:uncharacterized protein (TIGR00369 family)